MKKVIVKIILITVILNTVQGNTRAQEVDSLYHFSGQVVDEISNKPVSFAHVINIDQRWGVVSDTLGYFTIWVQPGDTLNISAIGYHYLNFGVEGFLKDTLVLISLENRAYQIPEAKISYLGTYKEFEYKVVNLKLPDDGINPELKKIFKHVEVEPVAAPSSSILNPISMFYSAFSKEAKDIRRYLYLTEDQDVIDEARKKFNEDIIRNLTGLEGLEARKFMVYCDFSDDYIVRASEYELYNRIMDKYELYKKSEKDSVKVE